MGKQKVRNRKKKHIPFRLNILFFVVFLLFSSLILRLGVVQIVYGEDYRRELERTEDITVSKPVPRGKIYDRSGKTVVDNTPVNTITYTRFQGTKTEEMLEIAETLAKLIDKETNKVTERDKKDFWIMKNPEKAAQKITEKEKKLFEEKKLTDKELYKIQLEKITEEELNEISNSELEVLAIYRELSSAKALTPQIVKNKGVTPEEIALVSENLEELPGIDVTTDWERKYNYDKTLKSVIGKVTSSEEGLPLEKLDYYLSRGYSNNDRVGKSYLELQYEDILHGQKAKVQNVTDKSGNVLETKVISEGQRGKDLVLNIDMDLQLAVEKIIEDELRVQKSRSGSSLLDRAFVVLMNPKTGEVVTMAGKQYDRDEKTGKVNYNDFALGNFTTSYTMGSSVKGATVLAGLQSGAITPNTGFMDSKLYIKGTPPKGSYKNLGYMNIENALKKSSNVFMFRTAIEMGGGTYRKNEALRVNPKAYDTMRYYYSQFGLGVRTGIDLPNEMAGFKGNEKSPGKLLDLSIGQYDTYTPLQLAQYVSTVANGGKRLQPQIVKEIREPSDDPEKKGALLKEISPKVMNTVDMKQSWIKQVQSGFRKVTQEQGGTGYSAFRGTDYKMAGKTGTAQAFYDGPLRSNYSEPVPVINLTFVGYAPSDNPEIAISVVVPWAYQGKSGPSINLNIARKVMDTYFDLKKQNQQQNLEDANETTE